MKSLRSLFDAPKASPSPAPTLSTLLGSELRPYAGAETLSVMPGAVDKHSVSSSTHSIKTSGGRKHDVEEKRRAKIAKLVDKEVMVLNTAQLAQIQQRNAHPLTISINSPFRRWWDLVVSLSMVYVMIAASIKVGFSVHITDVRHVVGSIVDVIYLLDTMLNFFTSYDDDATSEEANEFYITKSDRVSIRVLSDSFEIIPLGNLGEGSFFDEISLLTGEPQSAEVRAESIAELAYLTQSDFAAITDKFPTFFLAVKRISELRQQTATNVRKISRHTRSQSTAPNRKSIFRPSVTATHVARRNSRAFACDGRRSIVRFAAVARATTVKRISKRLSNSRRKQNESFNATSVEQLSPAQARWLSQLRAIDEVETRNPDEDIAWD